MNGVDYNGIEDSRRMIGEIAMRFSDPCDTTFGSVYESLTNTFTGNSTTEPGKRVSPACRADTRTTSATVSAHSTGV